MTSIDPISRQTGLRATGVRSGGKGNGVRVAVAVAVRVAEGLGVAVGVGVTVGVRVGVWVGVTVRVGVAVRVAVIVGDVAGLGPAYGAGTVAVMVDAGWPGRRAASVAVACAWGCRGAGEGAAVARDTGRPGGWLAGSLGGEAAGALGAPAVGWAKVIEIRVRPVTLTKTD